MTKSPRSDAPSLTELRREIDRIDEAMHRLLIERSEIIGRLIKAKQTQEQGSAFRPAREADMMRRLVDRHSGILPLDTVESIWRVIISTFTYVQAPFSVHADISASEPAMPKAGTRPRSPLDSDTAATTLAAPAWGTNGTVKPKWKRAESRINASPADRSACTANGACT